MSSCDDSALVVPSRVWNVFFSFLSFSPSFIEVPYAIILSFLINIPTQILTDLFLLLLLLRLINQQQQPEKQTSKQAVRNNNSRSHTHHFFFLLSRPRYKTKGTEITIYLKDTRDGKEEEKELSLPLSPLFLQHFVTRKYYYYYLFIYHYHYFILFFASFGAR